MSIGGMTNIPPNLLSRVATSFDSVSAGIGTASSTGGASAVQDGLQSFEFASSLDNVMADGSAHIADGSVFPSPGPFFEKNQEIRSGKVNLWDHQFEGVSRHLQDLTFDITDGLGTFSQNLFGDRGLAQNISDVLLNPQPLPPGPPDPDSIRSSVVGKISDDLNPQPLPPGPPDPDGIRASLFGKVADDLNPQPLPPGPPDPDSIRSNVVGKFADELNPQPLPPGPPDPDGMRSDLLSKVADDLNPQPLPPGPPDPDGRKIDLRDLFAAVALNPQPLPPGPPDPDALRTSGLGDVADDLNPQPLPPGPPEFSAIPLNLTDLLSDVERFADDEGPEESRVNTMNQVADDLNPQPLPPGPSGRAFFGTLANFGTMDDVFGQARNLDATSQQAQFLQSAFALQFNRLQSMQDVLQQTSSLMQDVERQTSKFRL